MSGSIYLSLYVARHVDVDLTEPITLKYGDEIGFGANGFVAIHPKYKGFVVKVFSIGIPKPTIKYVNELVTNSEIVNKTLSPLTIEKFGYKPYVMLEGGVDVTYYDKRGNHKKYVGGIMERVNGLSGDSWVIQNAFWTSPFMLDSGSYRTRITLFKKDFIWDSIWEGTNFSIDAQTRKDEITAELTRLHTAAEDIDPETINRYAKVVKDYHEIVGFIKQHVKGVDTQHWGNFMVEKGTQRVILVDTDDWKLYSGSDKRRIKKLEYFKGSNSEESVVEAAKNLTRYFAYINSVTFKVDLDNNIVPNAKVLWLRRGYLKCPQTSEASNNTLKTIESDVATKDKYKGEEYAIEEYKNMIKFYNDHIQQVTEDLLVLWKACKETFDNLMKN